MDIPSNIIKIIQRLKWLVTDFDGVWTDGKVYFSESGEETVLCSRKDTLHINKIKDAGIQIAVISKEGNPVVSARCKKIQVECFQGVDDKLSLLKKLLAERKVSPEDVSYVGDDVNDLDCLRLVSFPITVVDGHEECKKVAKFITSRAGGDHAMREIFDLILKVRK